MAKQEKDHYWYSLLLESIDATRTMLVHAARSGSHRVIMIASALPGEGKTSLASHLATSLARSGQKTLLIDADLRCPSIHRLFDLAPDPGLSELLRGEICARGCDRLHGGRGIEGPHRGEMRPANPADPGAGRPGRPLRPAQRAVRFRDRRLLADLAGRRRPDHRPAGRRGPVLGPCRCEPEGQGSGRLPADRDPGRQGARRGGHGCL